MKKLFLTTVLVLMFVTPAIADGAKVNKDKGGVTHDGGGTSQPPGGGSPPPNPTGITLVQQLQGNLNYQTHEWIEDGSPTSGYHFYSQQRLTKQLAAAQAAAAAGHPGNPILQENGQVAPINTLY